jgi:hypothetical protein
VTLQIIGEPGFQLILQLILVMGSKAHEHVFSRDVRSRIGQGCTDFLAHDLIHCGLFLVES